MGGDLILRRLLGLQHREIMRSGQPWLEISGLTPEQCAGYQGMFRERKLSNTLFEIKGAKAELAEVERITREVEEECAA